MSSAKASLLAAMVAIALASLWSYRLRHDRWAEARELRAANAKLQHEVLAQDRASRAPAPAANAPAAAAASNEPPAAEAPREDLVHADYRFQGQATPVDTLQTMAWAMDRGDVDLMGQVITFDEPARAKLEAYRAALPPEAQQQWPTVDVLAATLLTSRGISQPYPRTDLLARATIEPISTDRVLVRLPGTPKDRETYQKIGDTWKWVITEALVEKYLQRVARSPAPNS